MVASLVLIESAGDAVSPASLSTITAAFELGGTVDLLMIGSAQSAAMVSGVRRVLVADGDASVASLAEVLAPLLVKHASDYTHILCAASTLGKDVMPRLAALIDSQQISDITMILDADTFKHPVYAGNVIETVKSSDTRKVLTVRPTAFAAAEMGSATAEIVSLGAIEAPIKARFVELQASVSERPDLGSAKRVVSGGRAFGSKEKFAELVEPLADKLGAAIGASRAAVDAGYVPNDCQVGQTGKVVAPELYIALGISGAIQHLAGMKDSKIIVAINKDENAPIFESADYSLVGDLFELVPDLTAKL